ncbi:hypothetical protein A3A54_00455 [Candidatus Curtissbacteria bacterium RIFCSPLOWO2_01_FULL_39_62]|uniref:Putative gluconeogenesis factor n=2 Tax=Candidatus Curtissiibacteriota TaxID=1752717 RepID=A0A1F5GCD6_9BACT|nr:MAG: hypothetical protein A2775_02045 [Candidatus Curtissbacteria bacterium RIFCSPHIGHO2_01_FULL_39_57]OGD89511.1 MAG: hypothetical protein A3D04_00345 [Candidatus Curtissbacteria bacterium RIFCSPHIGHO2_02_FULL_40_16b]OGD90734.1 MAG: hypothetical protein A3E11_01920 [Candidatus Curtissbacteria bacterium RIFCSPHIGHO2_12_FULL_38_37]OGD99386.1 MAG: hypothetical protein A3J17_02465 [Candidatus Curtissbacteria bacterium RIFCSPLOWO2_02_FULL_40_11]OGE01505.1 MAG: hypothetical protein A3A54_00455 [C
MLKKFLKNYFELPAKKINIVCLGGGIGTAQILKGLRNYPVNLTAIVSMADDGGSAGRLRRAFAVPPTGDIVNCLSALSDEESVLKDLFIYRFAGKRYGKDTDIGGQKLGNLIFVALTDIYKGDTNKALVEFSRIISSKGTVLPATTGDVNIWAKTKDNKKVFGEENIDLGKYNGSKKLKEVHLVPANANAYAPSITAIKEADIIVAGPGDLFSTVLPVLIVPQINKTLRTSKARKLFIVNTTNKPFETVGFKVSNYIDALINHIGGSDVFDTILVNTNHKPKIPTKINYRYVEFDINVLKNSKTGIHTGDFVNREYPLYHNSDKVAEFISKLIP